MRIERHAPLFLVVCAWSLSMFSQGCGPSSTEASTPNTTANESRNTSAPSSGTSEGEDSPLAPARAEHAERAEVAPTQNPPTPRVPRLEDPAERARTRSAARAAVSAEDWSAAARHYARLSVGSTDARTHCREGHALMRAGESDRAREALLRGARLHKETLSQMDEERNAQAMCLYNLARVVEESDVMMARRALTESLRLRDNRTVSENLARLGGPPEDMELPSSGDVQNHPLAEGAARVRVATIPNPNDETLYWASGRLTFARRDSGGRYRGHVVHESWSVARFGSTGVATLRVDSVEEVEIASQPYVLIAYAEHEVGEAETIVEENGGDEEYGFEHFTHDKSYLALCPIEGTERCRSLQTGERYRARVEDVVNEVVGRTERHFVTAVRRDGSQLHLSVTGELSERASPLLRRDVLSLRQLWDGMNEVPRRFGF